MTSSDRSARSRLARARLYLCTDARSERGDLAEFVDAALAGGVEIVQLRDKSLEARPQLEALEIMAEACRRHGALLAVNDRADIARAARSEVLHLGQDDLPPRLAREICGDGVLIGRSTHDQVQVDGAISEPEADYFCVGPCWPTPTKSGRPATTLSLLRYAARQVTPKPWFAIGGISAERLGAVLEAGARRVVVVRAITEAEDPKAAAGTLAAALRSAAAAGSPDLRLATR